MSVRASASGQYLSGSHTFASFGTGDITIGAWGKQMVDINDYARWVQVIDAYPNPVGRFGLDRVDDGVTMYASTNDVGTTGYNAGLNTWVYSVARRQSGVMQCFVFADDVGLTSLFSSDTPAETTNLTGMTALRIFEAQDTALGRYFDGEITNVKIHVGVAWTTAQMRTEATTFGVQTAGGNERYCYGLETTSANQYGLNEFGGSGPTLDNNGTTNGASRPSQLEAAGASILNSVRIGPTQPNKFYFIPA